MVRVFSVSDLHVDYKKNLQWVINLSEYDYQGDYLICAGDISHNLKLFSITMEFLSRKFKKVLFVPGNHDLWIRDKEAVDSLEKFKMIRDICQSFNISQAPLEINTNSTSALIYPIFSWYTKPEEGNDSLFIPKKMEDTTLSMWVDNREIKWPVFDGFSYAAEYFLSLNNQTTIKNNYDVRITFSHFLPRNDLIFDLRKAGGLKDPYPQFNFTRVAGSSAIDKQLRYVRSNVHIYGHQHRNRFRKIENVLYVSHILGNPKERKWAGITDNQYLPKQIWSSEDGICSGTEN